MGLGDNDRLCGGSPWEVPWGEAVGEKSFATLGRIYTGYVLLAHSLLAFAFWIVGEGG